MRGLHRNGPVEARIPIQPVTVLRPETNPTRDGNRIGLLSTLEIHAICGQAFSSAAQPLMLLGVILRRSGVNVTSEAIAVHDDPWKRKN